MREWTVTSGLSGYHLVLVEVPAWRRAVEWAIEDTLAGLGHPCCFRGVGRLGVPTFTVRGREFDGWQPIGAASFRLLQWAANFPYQAQKEVWRHTLTEAEAMTIVPGTVQRWRELDEDD